MVGIMVVAHLQILRRRYAEHEFTVPIRHNGKKVELQEVFQLGQGRRRRNYGVRGADRALELRHVLRHLIVLVKARPHSAQCHFICERKLTHRVRIPGFPLRLQRGDVDVPEQLPVAVQYASGGVVSFISEKRRARTGSVYLRDVREVALVRHLYRA